MQMHPVPRHVDVFACGSTLRNLLKFLQGRDSPFRMLVEVVAGTVHLIRRENTPKERIPGVRGYGHTFPEAFTTWEADVKRSLSHQRIVSYRFCGLDMMVRFEGDGYIRSEKTRLETATESDMLDQLDSLSVDREGKETNTDNTESILHIGNVGVEIEPDDVFDLKTRSVKRQGEDILGEELPRLWVTQIPKFILAFHERGLFTDVRIQSVKERVQDWEVQNESLLRGLFHLLSHIVDIAGDYEDSELEIVRPAGGGLEIRERGSDAGKVLSDSVRRRWATWLREGENAAQAVACDLEDASEEDSDQEADYTACDAECAYCGKCNY
ncbi:uncharacterized protein MAM_02571 [Metarhizium album ARSEF 1941]|uniref:Geranylgeranyl pyrophosphate synthetase n=1 Tax=Metarhizium album (strain ARSEF 1941) TaxID=1081103 RepID=A0A0B2X099_METAS|nr:uncharacterized protein MAM_02571 [Metarhizium album ARSEF 1941]KHN99718.1 hypothetical protein MAM_02571 [Metarhizium album ARSEF 1941]